MHFNIIIDTADSIQNLACLNKTRYYRDLVIWISRLAVVVGSTRKLTLDEQKQKYKRIKIVHALLSRLHAPNQLSVRRRLRPSRF